MNLILNNGVDMPASTSLRSPESLSAGGVDHEQVGDPDQVRGGAPLITGVSL